METLARLLFEQPYLQGVFMLIAVLVAGVGWWRARFEPESAKRWALAAVILVILGVAGQITARLVTTDRERIAGLFEQAAVAVEKADVPTLLAMTDEGLDVQGLDQQQFARWLEGLFRRVQIRKPAIQDLQVTFRQPDSATAIVSGVATIDMQGYSHIATGTWKVDLAKIAGQWKVVALEPREPFRHLPVGHQNPAGHGTPESLVRAAWSVRSKCSGVTDTYPARKACRSVSPSLPMSIRPPVST